MYAHKSIMSTKRRSDRARRVAEAYTPSEHDPAFAKNAENFPPVLHQKSLAGAAQQVSFRLKHQTDTDLPSTYSKGSRLRMKGSKTSESYVVSENGYHARASYRSKRAATRNSVAANAIAPNSSSSAESMLSQGELDGYEGVFLDKRRSPIGLITAIFTCWSKTKEVKLAAEGELHKTSHSVNPFSETVPRLNKITAAALLEQTKAQQEALLEIQDTSDMWEWLMEQQQALANKEHDIFERRSNVASTDQLLSTSVATSARSALVPSGDRASAEESERPVVRHKKPSEAGTLSASPGAGDDGEDEEWDSKAWASPISGRRHQEEIRPQRVPQMFEAALMRYRWEVNAFCRIYMQQIVKAGYSLINTLMELEPRTVFLRRVHASYALEARINAVMFRCFESDSFDESGLTHILDPGARAKSRVQEFVRMRPLDPSEALRMHSASYEPAFHTFAASKSEEVLPLLPAAALAFHSAEQRDRFMDAFLRVAKWAWLLHRVATATLPTTTILRVAKGHAIDPIFVEAVAVPPIGSCRYCPPTSLPTVEFMIMPGFLLPQEHVFRCRVYQHFMCKSPPALSRLHL
ncbi:hypothetical protein KP509_11G001700 [Ceratopteris richardii]|uniref:Uncharacterized protein n=1 Tax=Ceratopteris richardii TaxID=49495 RepID=A0A8T2TSB0_CERRI|nr:hypothetical protein KP509_11G001700 [Ceratopteris richardii]